MLAEAPRATKAWPLRFLQTGYHHRADEILHWCDLPANSGLWPFDALPLEADAA